ncbi:hypothetical protein STSP2_03008 [Anaerohalosphaera lusitana]|uniref:Ice-binding protein C-terminal domain-containing protein n=1 Tax=Anaerohalosphaera lusitana TaxID=1936003 RepID=A0A1U9NPG7_9BACT|nr:PEP-CTERM sorting domain-containing protein [Anaerohalosphaera lusitana]AQT69811.1 hypothetical protein STSP2_03008 [Anaerohalosphaera lusitana]
MKKFIVLTCVMALAAVSSAATVWNPAGNGITPPDTGLWGDAANWTGGLPGDTEAKAVFNVPGAAEAQVAGSYSGFQVVQGDNNPGGVLRVLNGGTITTVSDNWSAVGYNDTAQLIVEAGGTFNFGQHAWIGLNDGAVGTVDIFGTVTVGSMLGLGWGGSTSQGFVNVYDGGLLALANIHGDGSSSIKHGSLLNINGTGKVTLLNDRIGTINDYAANGLIAGDGIIGNVEATYDEATNLTTVTVVPEPATLSLLGLGALAMLKRKRD